MACIIFIIKFAINSLFFSVLRDIIQMVGTLLMCVCACVEFVKCNKVCVVTDRSLCQNDLADDTLPYSSLKCWYVMSLYMFCVFFFHVLGGCLCY